MRRMQYIVLVFVLAVLSGVAIAQSEMEIPEVSGVVTDEGLEFPTEISAGLVTLTFENQRTEATYVPIIARLNDGVTAEDFFESMASGDEMAPVFMLTFYGGTEVPVGESFGFTTELPEGDYLILEFSEDSQSQPHVFSVVASDMEQPVAPEADVTVAMVDFAFGVPATMEAGPQVWAMRNFGEQWHEAAIFKLEEDLPLSEVIDGFTSEEQVPYGDSVFFWAPVGADVTSWVTIDLEPGHYVIACFLPNIQGDFSSHLMNGMVAVFSVE